MSAMKPTLRELLEMSDSIIIEIGQTLEHYPCLHGPAKSDHATAPMFFPEWIRCVVAQARKQAQP